jgi:hypothetical protein
LLDDVQKDPQRVIVGVSGSLGSLHALRDTAGERLVSMADRDSDLLVVGSGSGGALGRPVR